MKPDSDECCEWMSVANRDDKRRRCITTCCLTPVTVLVDLGLLKGRERTYPRARHLCAMHARGYFWMLNQQRGNLEYGPLVRKQQRTEELRRLRLDRAWKEINERRAQRRNDEAMRSTHRQSWR